MPELVVIDMKIDKKILKYINTYTNRHCYRTCISLMGIVRLTGLELADRKRSRPSRGELTPFSERGGAVLLEGIAAVEVAVLVEVIVDRGMGGGKFLQGFDVPELRHRAFSSSERLM